MNQVDLQKLAEERILDADALLKGGRWSYAYYVAGYAVECALKSCLLARMILTGWVFQEKTKPGDCLTHDFRKLIELAGLRDELDSQLRASSAGSGAFAANWDIVSQWNVTIRYEWRTESDARKLYCAICDDPDGVLKWIKTYW